MYRHHYSRPVAASPAALRYLASLATAILLTACGGGSGYDCAGEFVGPLQPGQTPPTCDVPKKS